MGTTGSGLWGGGGGGAGNGAATLVSSLIYDALRRSGILKGPQRGASQSEQADGLLALNRMLNSWNTERSSIYTTRIDLWPTQANKQTYTIGVDPTGTLTPDWAGPRPVRIGRANFLLPTSPTVRRPMAVWDDRRWAALRLQAVYTYPTALYNDGAKPLSTIYLYPVPDSAYQLELYTWQALEDGFLAVTDTAIFPPGYELAIVTNLAKQLCQMFGKPVPADVRDEARTSKAAIQRLNTRSPRIGTAPFHGTNKRGDFNWASGTVS